MNDDVPDAVLGVRMDETLSLSTNASIQEIDTSESLPALSGISTNTTLELAEDLRLPRLAHGLILGTLDGRALFQRHNLGLVFLCQSCRGPEVEGVAEASELVNRPPSSTP